MKMVLVRHGESVWNQDNIFTGWTDVDLTENGREEAVRTGRLFKEQGYDFDICYTSFLRRAIHTLDLILVEMDREWLPVIKSWKLNERHYGALQGLNKAEMAEKMGAEQVMSWRRSLSAQPPALDEMDTRNPRFLEQYRTVAKHLLPLSESLQETAERVISYYETEIHPAMLSGKRVLISAHGNTLRTLVMYFERLSEQDVVDVNIPNGVPLVYEFNWDFKVTKRYYLE